MTMTKDPKHIARTIRLTLGFLILKLRLERADQNLFGSCEMGT